MVHSQVWSIMVHSRVWFTMVNGGCGVHGSPQWFIVG